MSRKKGKSKKRFNNPQNRNATSLTQRSVSHAQLTRKRTGRAWVLLTAIGIIIAVVFWICSRRNPFRESIESNPPAIESPKFVGSAQCAHCHRREYALWRGSHHQAAMQPAGEDTVLGDFNRTNFLNDGIVTTFFHRGSKFMVRTDGPDGALHDYEIKYTFGVYPLQQYLIAMPGGRLQALGIAWDSRPRDSGGQRWFFLYPGQHIPPADRLHWTAIDQNWNYMCADCHSTNLRKNYDLRTHTYATSYAEIDVSCEACHGPGSNHAAWEGKQVQSRKFNVDQGLTITLNERKRITWSINSATGNPVRSSPRTTDREIELCARCHSRRGSIHEDFVHGQSVGDDYRLALLDRDLYFPDGQIKAEVYEYGSFVQSKMFNAGVTCSDCHEPHSLRLRAEGNNVCLQCHFAPRYDSPKHHFHKIGSPGAQCVACHMPTRTYMVIDARRDHSLRIPRPDLSVKLGTPNSCTNCHQQRPAQWAADAIAKWFGRTPVGFQHFADALDAASRQTPEAERSLTALVSDRNQPAIARATALSALSTLAPLQAGAVARNQIVDASPLVRRATARALSNSESASSAVALSPLLNDSVRAVRLETAVALADLPAETLSPDEAQALAGATAEYVAAQTLNADRPEAHLDMALLYARLRHFEDAEAELRTALSLDPTFAPAAVNLADIYRTQNRDAEGERILEDAMRLSPGDASLQHALGLLMIRQREDQKALTLLASAARMDPANARYSYVYAIALNDSGHTEEAIDTLERNLTTHPYDRDSLAAIVSMCAQADKPALALSYAQRLYALNPEDPLLQQAIKSLTAKVSR